MGTDQNNKYSTLIASGGEVSTAGTDFTDTVVPYPRPWWQQGVVPNAISGTARVLPDIALSEQISRITVATPFVCRWATVPPGSSQNASNLVFTSRDGTDVAAAVFGGIMSLVVQQYGAQGSANPTLYAMSRNTQGVSNDVAVGSNVVACTGKPAITLATADGEGNYSDRASTVTFNVGVSGSGTPSGSVNLFANGQLLRSAVSNSNGTWTYVADSSTTSTGLLPLPLGTNLIVA